jgi:hypothetical protein
MKIEVAEHNDLTIVAFNDGMERLVVGIKRCPIPYGELVLWTNVSRTLSFSVAARLVG